MIRTLARHYSTLAQRARGWDYRQDLSDLQSMERWTEDQRTDYRIRKLRDLLTHCGEAVPFYRDHFRSIGFDPREIRSEAEIDALPIITKDVLREEYHRFHSQDPSLGYSEWMTSGSTGQPFLFRLDRRSITRNTFAALERGRRWWGIEPGTPELMIWSGVRDISESTSGRFRAWRRRLSWGLKNILLVNTYDLDSAKVAAAYEDILRFRPTVTRSISSGLYRFCSLLTEMGLDGRRLGIRHAIYTGESFPEAQKRLVESVLGCETICEYGCSELGILAFECPAHRIHMMSENFTLEYRCGDRAARPGEEAELVATNLSSHAAPLIRYAVGDCVIPSADVCDCGRTMPLIESVAGRAHATIRTPSGAVVHGLFFTHLFDDLPIVHRFQVVQDSLNDLRIDLTSTETIPNEVRSSIRAAVERVMGPEVSVRIEQVADLPLSRSGKFRWIVSHVKDGDSDPMGEIE